MDRDDNMRLVTFRVIKVLKRLIEVFCGFHSINSATKSISKMVEAQLTGFSKLLCLTIGQIFAFLGQVLPVLEIHHEHYLPEKYH